MTNPSITLVAHIQNRQSIPLLQSPSPNQSQWQSIIAAGCAAPDHGRLRPWQFLLIEGEGLQALGDLFVSAQIQLAKQAGTTLTEQQISRTQLLPQRAPAILVVIAKIVENHKIPVIEQISACAAAAQNIQLALAAKGFGCIWRTGEFAIYDAVKTGLGFSGKDAIVGFLYVGTAQKQPPTREPQALSTCFNTWPAPLEP